MDTTYFGRNFGVMLFKDSSSGKNLYKQYVKHETNSLYAAGVSILLERGFDIKAIVCDGRKGLLSLFPSIPLQMCQFHQVAIITRYLTRKPKLQAAKELREHVLLLARTDKESFEGGFGQLAHQVGNVPQRANQRCRHRQKPLYPPQAKECLQEPKNQPALALYMV